MLDDRHHLLHGPDDQFDRIATVLVRAQPVWYRPALGDVAGTPVRTPGIEDILRPACREVARAEMELRRDRRDKRLTGEKAHAAELRGDAAGAWHGDAEQSSADAIRG